MRPVKPPGSEGIPSATSSVSARTGRAEMTGSAAANASRRLRILTDEEIEALYGRPCFSADDRAASFTLTPVEHDLLRSFRGVPSQMAFLLQFGYFKATQLFFPVRFSAEEVADDMAYLLACYFPDSRHADLRSPNKRTVLRQHRVLLAYCGYRFCTARDRRTLAQRAADAARLNCKPVYVFRELLQYLTEQRLVVPGYTVLQEIVGAALAMEQTRLEELLRTHLTSADTAALDHLLNAASGLHPITRLKHEPKDFSLREMRQEIGRATELRPLAHLADRVLPHLGISNEGIKYYASLVRYYSIFRLRQVDTHTAYLYLLCFATHRYQRAHDHLLTCFLHKVKQYVDETKAVAKEGMAAHRIANQRDLSKAGTVLKLFTAEETDAATPFGTVQARAFTILDRARLDRVADHLAKTAVCDEVALQWAHVDTLAPQFKRHLRPLLQAVDLSAAHAEAPLLAAIAVLKRTFAKGQPLSQLPEGAIPTRCIPTRLRRYLYEQVGREARRLRVDRYEFWVYRLVRQGLEAGDLSCRQSVRFRSFEDDLISDDAWHDKEALIARLGLPVLAQPITAQLADLEHQLEERLQAVNQRIASGDNAHIQITRRGAAVRWTLAYPRSTATVNHALFDALPPRDIGSIVHFVDRRCPFLHHFDHLLPASPNAGPMRASSGPASSPGASTWDCIAWGRPPT